MNRIWIYVGFLVVLLAIGGAFLLHQRQARAAAATAPSDTYTAAIVRGDIVQSVASTGQVVSNLDVAIKCRASGEVIQLPYDISDKVKKGDLLVQLDKKDEIVLVKQAQANVDQASSKLKEAIQYEKQAELDLQTATEKADAAIISAQIKSTNLRNKADRQHQLLTQSLASQEDYETAETDTAQADNDLQTARIAKESLKSQAVALEVKKEDVNLSRAALDLTNITLENAKQQLAYTTVTAPMDGVIADQQIEIGTIISSATSNVSGGATVISLSDLSRIFVKATVDESDIGNVQVGQAVNITADAYPGKKFAGKVVRIATQGVTASNVVTFEVKIEITSENKSVLKPQMTANVQIVEASRDNVLTVPVLAIVRREHKQFATVAKPDGSNEERAVTTGISDGDNDEVVSGLNEGDQVVVHRNEATNKWTSNGGSRGMGMPGGRR
ncbi:MAG: efflux RND transporter periplasmic adaptor subunit [Planctomycetota bacterium]|nr:efflux RND transporter periplasmic adaptor subunit [Planctomycetota bacterium]